MTCDVHNIDRREESCHSSFESLKRATPLRHVYQTEDELSASTPVTKGKCRWALSSFWCHKFHSEAAHFVVPMAKILFALLTLIVMQFSCSGKGLNLFQKTYLYM